MKLSDGQFTFGPTPHQNFLESIVMMVLGGIIILPAGIALVAMVIFSSLPSPSLLSPLPISSLYLAPSFDTFILPVSLFGPCFHHSPPLHRHAAAPRTRATVVTASRARERGGRRDILGWRTRRKGERSSSALPPPLPLLRATLCPRAEHRVMISDVNSQTVRRRGRSKDNVEMKPLTQEEESGGQGNCPPPRSAS
eukprot:757665-Hanusia_phi.AAC.3